MLSNVISSSRAGKQREQTWKKERGGGVKCGLEEEIGSFEHTASPQEYTMRNRIHCKLVGFLEYLQQVCFVTVQVCVCVCGWGLRSIWRISGVFLRKLLCTLACVQMYIVTGAWNVHIHTHIHTRSLYLVSCSQQVISHLVQVGGLACVDEAHHLFEDIWLHVIYLHTVLKREERTGEENTRRV